MLGRANEALSIRLAGSEVKVHALSSQLEVAEARVLELQVRGGAGSWWGGGGLPAAVTAPSCS